MFLYFVSHSNRPYTTIPTPPNLLAVRLPMSRITGISTVVARVCTMAVTITGTSIAGLSACTTTARRAPAPTSAVASRSARLKSIKVIEKTFLQLPPLAYLKMLFSPCNLRHPVPKERKRRGLLAAVPSFVCYAYFAIRSFTNMSLCCSTNRFIRVSR